MEKRLYAAYGTDLSKAWMQHRCPTAKPIAVATLRDHQLTFQIGPRGVQANVIHATGQEVPVVIWEVNAEDEIRLGSYKGVGDDLPAKEFMEINVCGEMKKALVYITDPRPWGVPNDSYLNTMAKGYMDFDLPVSVLNETIIHAYKNTVTNGSAPAAQNGASLKPAR